MQDYCELGTFDSPAMTVKDELRYSREISTSNGTTIIVESEPFNNGHIVSISERSVIETEDEPIILIDNRPNIVVDSFSESLDILGDLEKLEVKP